MFDILIRDGTIVDGTGTKPLGGDIGIKEDKIFAVGGSLKEKGRREIDAAGLVIAPGFVDIQNHSDSYGALFENPSLESMLRQGITTILIGQCGSSLAPLLRGSLASIQKWTNIGGINVNWLSTAEYLRTVETKGLGVNLATLIGHGTLRRDFVRDEPRALNEKEQEQIGRLVNRSLSEGSWGLSVGLEYAHERAAEEQELINLLTLTANTGGIASFHLRNEGTEIASAVQEIIYLVRKSGVRAKISHFKKKMDSSPEFVGELLATLEKAKKDGVEIWLDVYPYTTSAGVLYLLLPEWATEGGRLALLKRLKDKTLRAEISGEMEKKKLPYEKITIASGSFDRAIAGKTIAEIAKRQGRNPEEVIFDLLLLSDDQIVVFFKNLHEPIVEMFLKHPQTMIATDGSGWSAKKRARQGLEHPRSFGSTARVLARYVRERKTLTLKDAVYKMSGLPAQFLGLEKRGTIKQGGYADIVVFDKNKIKDRATFQNPYHYPEGIEYVLVNGQIVVENGEYGGALAGRVLKKP